MKVNDLILSLQKIHAELIEPKDGCTCSICQLMRELAFGELRKPSGDAIQLISDKAKEHCETWRDQPEGYWLARLMQEVGEAASSLIGDHEHPLEWELIQIASICVNWLEMRKSNE